MASLVLSGDTSGSITVSAPAVSGSNTQTLAAVTGTLAPVVSGTAVTASGTSVDFTGIPSWVKRITVMFSGVSTNGTNPFLVQIGDSGGIETTGYVSGNSAIGNSAIGVLVTSTVGFVATSSSVAAQNINGAIILLNVNGSTWVAQGNLFMSATATYAVGGTKTLSDTLTQLRIIGSTTGSPTDTFDAGTINILYE